MKLQFPWLYFRNHVKKRDLPLFAYRCGEVGAQLIAVVGGDAAPLPNEIIVSPGKYLVDGNVFDLSLPGCYRFAAPGRISRQVLVPSVLPEETVEATQWFHGYGTSDNLSSSVALLRAATTRRVWVTCSRAALLAFRILQLAGFQARLVSVLTLEEWNAYDNGHTLLEVKLDAGWTTFDPAYGVWPTIDGAGVSVTDLCAAVRTGLMPCIQPLQNGSSLGQFMSNDEDLSIWLEGKWGRPEILAVWYGRIAQVAMIEDAGYYYFSEDDSEKQARVLGYSRRYRALAKDIFLQRFYP
jgi:hypothetical protein